MVTFETAMCSTHLVLTILMTVVTIYYWNRQRFRRHTHNVVFVNLIVANQYL